MKFVIDIFDNTGKLINNFAKEYGLKLEDNMADSFENFFEANKFSIFEKPEKYLAEGCEFNILKIDDVVNIYYLPYSQKYLDHYKSVVGRIIYLDSSSQNGILYYDIQTNEGIVRHINSFEREYCSYYGDTRGYCIFIERLVL